MQPQECLATRKVSSLEVKASYFHDMRRLLSNRLYLCTVMLLTSIYFILTGIQYWGPDYAINVMNMESTETIQTYSIVTITAPTIGVVFGGALSHKFGGYTGSNAITLLCALGSVATVCALTSPYVGWSVFVALLWFVLFFGAALMPTLTGIMLRCVDEDLKPWASSFSGFLCNLLGYLPSPFIYGLVCQYTGGEKSPWGMFVNMNWGIFSIICMFGAYRCKEAYYRASLTDDQLLEALQNPLMRHTTQNTA